MRILVISNFYPPVVRGGYEVECSHVVARLRESHEVVVLTSTAEREGIAPDAGVLRALPALRHMARDALRAPMWALRGVRVLRKTLAAFRPELVYVWNGAQIPQAVLRVLDGEGLPLAYRVCEHWFGGLYRSDQYLRHLYPGDRGLRAVWAQGARLVNRHPELRLDLTTRAPVAISWNSQYLRRHTPVPPTFIPVHEAMAYPVTPRAEVFGRLERRPRAETTIAFVGRLTREKGPQIAYRALAALRDRHGMDARLVLAGDADPEIERELAELAGELGIADRVDPVGRLDEAQLGDLLSGAHALVLPAMWEEPAPLTCIEGALARVPVVAARSGGIPEMLHEREHALFFPIGDADACADALAEAFSDPAATEARVARAFARGSEFSFESYWRSTEHFLHDTMTAFAARGMATAPGRPRAPS